MNLGNIGGIISLLTTFLFVIGGLVTIRARRLSREASELRELREMNVAAMGYIYEMDMAMQQAMALYHFKINVEKPEVLKRSYIEAQAATTQNTELQQIATLVQALNATNPARSMISGEKSEQSPKSE